jgi:hypothetical protein
LLPAAERLCARPWRAVEAEAAGAINAERYCTWGPYVHALLGRGLGVAGRRLRFGSGDIGWPLGAAVVEAGKLPGFMPAAPARGGDGGARWARRRRRRRLGTAAAWAVAAGVALCALGAWRLAARGRRGGGPLPRRGPSVGALPLYAAHAAGGKLRPGSAYQV